MISSIRLICGCINPSCFLVCAALPAFRYSLTDDKFPLLNVKPRCGRWRWGLRFPAQTRRTTSHTKQLLRWVTLRFPVINTSYPEASGAGDNDPTETNYQWLPVSQPDLKYLRLYTSTIYKSICPWFTLLDDLDDWEFPNSDRYQLVDLCLAVWSQL